MGLPGTVPGYLVSMDPWDSMPGRLPRTILGILGYLVSQDQWDCMPGGSSWDRPGYPGILSTMGTILDT